MKANEGIIFFLSFPELAIELGCQRVAYAEYINICLMFTMFHHHRNTNRAGVILSGASRLRFSSLPSSLSIQFGMYPKLILTTLPYPSLAAPFMYTQYIGVT